MKRSTQRTVFSCMCLAEKIIYAMHWFSRYTSACLYISSTHATASGLLWIKFAYVCDVLNTTDRIAYCKFRGMYQLVLIINLLSCISVNAPPPQPLHFFWNPWSFTINWHLLYFLPTATPRCAVMRSLEITLMELCPKPSTLVGTSTGNCSSTSISARAYSSLCPVWQTLSQRKQDEVVLSAKSMPNIAVLVGSPLACSILNR